MKHLILGSSGQIGLSLYKFLLKNNESPITFDIVDDFAEDLRLKDNRILLEKIDDADFVHFLAFDVGGSRYLKTYQHTQDFLSNNVRLMEYTFKSLRDSKKPFIFASSQMSNMSYSPYGTLKALGEAYTKSLNGLVVKFWNVYGVEHDPLKTHVITDFLNSAKNTKIINMLTDGEEQRQFLHAEDCSRCLNTLAYKYEEIPRDKNLHITSFDWISIYEIAKIVGEVYPGTIIKRGELKDTVQLDKRNEPDPYIFEYWRPQIKLIDGIRLISKEL